LFQTTPSLYKYESQEVDRDMRRAQLGAKWLWLFGLLLIFAMVIPPTTARTSGPDADLASLLTTALGQLNLALQQAVYAHVRFPLEDLKALAHIVLNVLEGSRGPHFNPRYPSDADGVGVITYVQQISQAREIQQAPEDQQDVWKNNLQNVSVYLELAVLHTLNALAQTDLSLAQGEMRKVLAFLSAAKGRENELLAAGGLLSIQAKVGELGGMPPSQEK
jgi:hypothetical protein